MSTVIAEVSANLSEKISQAMKKLEVTKEIDLCKFLSSDGVQMHHFTFNKLKVKEPEQLIQKIEAEILDHLTPTPLPVKKRSQYKPNSKRRAIQLTDSQLNRLLDILREKEEYELMDALKPFQSINHIKNQLIKELKQGNLDMKLVETFLSIKNQGLRD